MIPSQRHVDLALVGVAAAWGSSYLAAKNVVPADGVFAFLALRFAIATIGLAVVLAPRRRRISGAELVPGLVFGAILALILSLETFGVTRTSAANAGLIISLTIVLTPLLARGEGPARAYYGAAALALAGVIALTQSGGFAAPGLGDLSILLAAVARSAHVIVIARLSRGRCIDAASLTLVQLGTALGVFVVLSSCTGASVVTVATGMDARSWLLTVHLAVVCTVFAFLVQMWAARRTSPARVSLLLGTEPVWAAMFGVLVSGDPVTMVGGAGALMILAGTHWARAVDGRRATSPSA